MVVYMSLAFGERSWLGKGGFALGTRICFGDKDLLWKKGLLWGKDVE